MFYIPTVGNLGIIKINGVGLGSTFTIGSAQLISRKNTNKKNQGFGQQSADFSTISLPIQTVEDADLLDAIVING
ncbi:hypothetical protein PH210_24390 [Paenibacillus sp. BSR1-1]|uniref:hypothetical protein n=1 Tax=Paenibacillus sp. BSR1-1 TaxID=3020845 RepID=UPI0025B0E35E|nr:hypothetical protein [Paenibacillus sp. BSR1-1]MDN3019314.1 hypothetical protein [Paenibacillus sp. BSR1-1]